MWLGRVITVIGDRPFRFAVNAAESDGNDTSDPLSQTPLTYIFEDASRHHSIAAKNFVVRVSSRLIRRQDEQVSKETHNEAIRFGLRSLVSDPEAREFFLTTESLDNQRAAEILEGQRLRATILRFIWTVNKIWPDQGVGVPDLADNFYNTDDELKKWVQELERAELLVRKRGFTQFRLGRGQVKMQSFAIHSHPQKQREIEDLLKSRNDIVSTKVKIFMSYSTGNKHLAGKVYTELTRYGLDVFMAHEDLKVSSEWRERILDEIGQCDVFVPLLSKRFRDSKWTDQESGYALALKKVFCPLYIGDWIPYGLMEEIQGYKLNQRDPGPACQSIVDVIKSHPDLATRFEASVQRGR